MDGAHAVESAISVIDFGKLRAEFVPIHPFSVTFALHVRSVLQFLTIGPETHGNPVQFIQVVAFLQSKSVVGIVVLPFSLLQPLGFSLLVQLVAGHVHSLSLQ